jgi:hypothetical protein
VEANVDWFWLLVVCAMFALFAGLVGLCGRVR